jgi:hypothetical protein
MDAAARKIDRSNWPSGPWDGEPDRVEFRAHGFPCLIQRNGGMGNLCGYVGVPPGHPWREGGDPDDMMTVHGGITYTSKCSGVICHVPEPGESDDVVWFGFDCAHGGDVIPAYEVTVLPGDEYRTIEYVRRECERLAAQAKAARAA